MNLWDGVRPEVRAPLERALEGHRLELEESLPLGQVVGAELRALTRVADILRERHCGPVVTYVVNRNVNFTNVCIKHCGFCAFSRDHRQEEGYFLPAGEVFRRVEEAVALGATEVCIQAGLAPKMQGDLYLDLTREFKTRFPNLHLHAFSPEEVLYGAIRSRRTVRDYLKALQEAGLDTLPGTSAEILDQPLRDRISPGRISVEQWEEVITTAHELGLRTTSTMMFGFLETPRQWFEHFARLRAVQERTGGFTEFVPLSFVHREAPMYRLGQHPGLRPGPTGVEVVRVHALARLWLGPVLRNIQASWVKEGPRLAQLLLDAGCNDLGGTLINESISTAAGASFGQFMPPAQLRRIIAEVGRQAAQRNTVYGILRTFSGAEPEAEGLLDQVGDPARFGSFHELVASPEHRFIHPLRVHS